jgi:hypothetical protein
LLHNSTLPGSFFVGVVVHASAPSTPTLLALVVAEEASKTANYIQVMHAYFLGS